MVRPSRAPAASASTAAVARPEGGRFAVALAAAELDVEHVDLVVARAHRAVRADQERAVGEAAVGVAGPEPRGCRSAARCRARPPPRGAGRASGPRPRSLSTAAWRARLAETMLVHSGVSTSVAPPAAASRTSASVTARFAAGIVAGAELDQRRAHRRQAREQRVELAGAVERVDVVEAADMPLADEDLRHACAGRRRAATISARRAGSPATSISAKATPFRPSSRFAARQ